MTQAPDVTPQDAARAVEEGREIAELRNLSPEAVSYIYAASALNYKRGLHREARDAFRFLCLHRHKDPDMWIALSRAEAALNDHGQSRKAALIAFALRPSAALALDMARAYLAAQAVEQASYFAQTARDFLAEGRETHLSGDVKALQNQLSRQR